MFFVVPVSRGLMIVLWCICMAAVVFYYWVPYPPGYDDQGNLIDCHAANSPTTADGAPCPEPTTTTTTTTTATH